MQHRTPSPNTQSGASVRIRAVIYVLTKPFFFAFLRACFIAGRRLPPQKKPSRHRRIIAPRLGLWIVAVRLVFWKAEIQARMSVLFPETSRSRRARPVRVLRGGRFIHISITLDYG